VKLGTGADPRFLIRQLLSAAVWVADAVYLLDGRSRHRSTSSIHGVVHPWSRDLAQGVERAGAGGCVRGELVYLSDSSQIAVRNDKNKIDQSFPNIFKDLLDQCLETHADGA